MSTISFMDVQINNVLKEDAVDMILKASFDRGKGVAFLNADCVNKLGDLNYSIALKNMDHVFADGIGVKLGCKVHGQEIADNVNGTDIFIPLLKKCEEEGRTVYFCGAKDHVVRELVRNIIEMFPKLKIVGYRDGFGTVHEMKRDVKNCHPDVLFVAMGAPIQECFINYIKKSPKIGVSIGVGGLFDFYSGRIRRAPLFLRKIKLEWVYRLLQEPERLWRRYILGNPLFVLRVFLSKLLGNYMNRNILYRYNLVYFEKMKMIYRNMKSSLKLNSKYLAKRSLDISLILLAMPVLGPLFTILSFLIKVTSRGPIFFRQIRVGRNGKRFIFYKFRSMKVNADKELEKIIAQNESKDGVIFKMKNDPRVTYIGKFLRRFSLDELPQLYNVFIGDMSLVGPRPPIPKETMKYEFSEYKRLDVMPGITCLWQVSGRSDIPFKQQVQLDLEYIRNNSVMNDIRILARTVPAVISGRGAY